MSRHVAPSGREIFFPASELIVSKTDPKGKLTYVNRVFCRLAGYREAELIGQPHNIIRHPEMPRAVFKLLWDAIQDGREIFAYVNNLARSGDHYWVFAHVTPSLDASGRIIGFHSTRRAPDRRVLEGAIIPLYAEVLRHERSHVNGKDALSAGTHALNDFVASQQVSYDQLMFTLGDAA